MNVHGLAHKVVFDAEFSFADVEPRPGPAAALRPVGRRLDRGLPPPAVDADLRRRDVPPQFDARFYALRTGMGGWVTAPSTEIADDLTAVRLGMRQRWQTKRGMPGNRRIIDWITLDTDADLVSRRGPRQLRRVARAGRLRLPLARGRPAHAASPTACSTSSTDGQQVITVGGFLSRPPRGSLYLGLRLLEGPDLAARCFGLATPTG